MCRARTPVEATYQAVFCLDWTTVIQKPCLQVDFHYISSGGATEDEPIIV